ncbi:MAG: PEGA domain-containing protein [Verrucomicrobiota bacterium]
MSAFYDKFLQAAASETERRPKVFLAAFGKHPGWNDHMDNVGLDTGTLSIAKSLMYVEGIGKQIDSGDWTKLEDGKRLSQFGHLFLWRRAGQFMLGRMWPSSDGIGRAAYPMIVCAQCQGVPLRKALLRMVPKLEEIETACQQVKTAQEVRSIIAKYREELNQIAVAPDAPVDAGEVPDVRPKPTPALLDKESEGWLRVLYQLSEHFGPYALGSFSAQTSPDGLRPQQIRLPAQSASPFQALLFWEQFLSTQLSPEVPLLLVLPLGQNWVDAIVGEPRVDSWYCLRVNTKVTPVASDVPYELTAEFVERARRCIAAFQVGQPTESLAFKPVEAQSPEGMAGIYDKLSVLRGGWFKRWYVWVGIGVAVLGLLGVLLMALLGRGGTGTLSVTSSPVAVEIVDHTGRSLGTVPEDGRSPLTLSLAAGKRTLIAKAPGFGDQTNQFLIQNEQVVPWKVVFPSGTVNLISDPPGAEVKMGTRSLGVTPLNDLPVPVGSVEFRLAARGYCPTNVQVVVTKDGYKTVKLQLEQLKGTVLFSNAFAKLQYLDENGNALGGPVNPGKMLVLPYPPGTYKFKAKLLEEVIRDDTNDIISESTVTVKAEAQVLADFRCDCGHLLITMIPPNAKLEINKQEVSLSVGKYLFQKAGFKATYVVTAEGYTPLITNYVAQPGLNQLALQLEKDQHLRVKLDSFPPGAEIVSDPKREQGIPITQITNRNQLPPQPRVYLRQYDLSDPKETRGTNVAGVVEISYEFSCGLAELSSSPPGAVVYYGNKKIETPTRWWFKPGPLELTMVLGGKTNVVSAYIVPDKSTNITGNFITNVAAMPTGTPAMTVGFKKAGTFTNSIGMVLTWIPNLPGTKGAYVGRFEVSQNEFSKVTKREPSEFNQAKLTNLWSPDLPVDSVSVKEAQEFCRQLTAQEHQLKRLPENAEYTLPTLKQWQIFADEPFYWDKENGLGRLQRDNAIRDIDGQPMDHSKANDNSYGLAFTMGNLKEWCKSEAASGPTWHLAGGCYTNVMDVFSAKKVVSGILNDSANIVAPETKSTVGGFRCILIEK